MENTFKNIAKKKESGRQRKRERLREKFIFGSHSVDYYSVLIRIVVVVVVGFAQNVYLKRRRTKQKQRQK